MNKYTRFGVTITVLIILSSSVLGDYGICDGIIRCPSSSPLTSNFLPHPTDCSKSYRCINGKAMIYSCPDCELFSYEEQKCVDASKVNCTRRCIEAPTEPAKPEETTTSEPVTTTESNVCDGIIRCPLSDSTVYNNFLPHPTDCSKSYRCRNGKPIIFSCPDGELFSMDDQKCADPSRVVCTRRCIDVSTPEITTEVTETPEITTEITDAPEISSETTEAPEITTEITDTPEISSETTEAPEITTEITDTPEITTEITDAPEITTTESSTSSEATTTEDTTQVTEDTTQATEETTQAPEITTEITDAPEGTTDITDAPETTTEITDAPEVTTTESSTSSEDTTTEDTTQVTEDTTEATEETTQATEETTRAPEVTTQAPEVTTQAPEVTTEGSSEINTCDASKCPAINGDYPVYLPHPDCTKFCVCDWGIAHVLECPPGLYFNPKLNVCDWPYNAGCEGFSSMNLINLHIFKRQ